MSDALFELPAEPVVTPMKYDLVPSADHDARARRYYAEAPAVTPFSKVPISFEQARAFGINSWAQADKRALLDGQGPHSS